MCNSKSKKFQINPIYAKKVIKKKLMGGVLLPPPPYV